MHTEILRSDDYVPARSRCTAFDRLLGLASEPCVALCYRERLDSAKLRMALIRVLGEFSAAAGKFVKQGGDLFIEHGVGGARFEIGESLERSRDLGEAARSDRRAAKRVFPSLSRWGRPPTLLAVRITECSDGSIVSLTMNHAAGDMNSIMSLMRAWTQAYRGEPFLGPEHVGDRAAYLEQHMPATNGPLTQYVASWSEWPRHAARFLTGGAAPVFLRFEAEQIAALQAAAGGAQSATALGALLAHVFSLVQRAHRPDMDSVLMLSLDYRRRLGMAPNAFGNFFDGLKVRFSASSDLASRAAAIRQHIRAFPTRLTYAHELERLHAQNPGFLRRMRCVDGDLDPRKVGTVLTITSGRGAGFNDIAFGEEKPVFNTGRAAPSMNWLGIVLESASDDDGMVVQLHVPSAVAQSVVREHQQQRNAPRVNVIAARSELDIRVS